MVGRHRFARRRSWDCWPFRCIESPRNAPGLAHRRGRVRPVWRRRILPIAARRRGAGPGGGGEAVAGARGLAGEVGRSAGPGDRASFEVRAMPRGETRARFRTREARRFNQVVFHPKRAPESSAMTRQYRETPTPTLTGFSPLNLENRKTNTLIAFAFPRALGRVHQRARWPSPPPLPRTSWRS